MHIDAQNFDILAREIFAPVYPIIAAQILKRTAMTSGLCLDLGCGSGYLGLAVSEQSDLHVTLLDASEDMLRIAADNIAAKGMQGRVTTQIGDVTAIPLPDNSADLAVSRGSVFFWKNQDRAFSEIHRVLAPGGRAMVGGGFGNAALQAEISRKMEAREKSPGAWRAMLKNNLSEDTARKAEQALRAANIENFTVELSQETGFWITISK